MPDFEVTFDLETRENEFEVAFDLDTQENELDAEFILYAPSLPYTFTNGIIESDNVVSLAIATEDSLGGVKIGEGLQITEEGLLSVRSASTENAGIIRIATEEEISEGLSENTVVTPKQLKEVVPTEPSDIGAQPEITVDNKLSADLIDDTDSVNKFITEEKLQQIDTNASDIAQNTQDIATNAAEIATKVSTIVATGNIEAQRVNNTVTLKSKSFVFEQGVASDTWVIVHNLGKKPSVVLVDSAGTVFTAGVRYDSENQCTVFINGATTGKAFLN